VTQLIAPIRTARPHRTLPVGVDPVDSIPTYALAIGRGQVLRRPSVLSGNEALFPDRARCVAAGGTRG
jgi:hypothetical protein